LVKTGSNCFKYIAATVVPPSLTSTEVVEGEIDKEKKEDSTIEEKEESNEPKGDPEVAPIYLKQLLPVFTNVFQSTMLPSVRYSDRILLSSLCEGGTTVAVAVTGAVEDSLLDEDIQSPTQTQITFVYKSDTEGTFVIRNSLLVAKAIITILGGHSVLVVKVLPLLDI
jgi:hypothetical protein